MTAFFTGLGRFNVRFRYPLAVLWIVVTIVSVRAFPSLSSVAKDQNSGFLPSNTPSVHASDLLAPFQNSKLSASDLIAARDNGPLTLADQAAIDHVEALIRAMPHVKLVRDEGVSRDGAARQALIEADVPAFGGGNADTLVKNIRTDFTTVGAPSGLQLHLAGQLPTVIDNKSASGKSQNRTQSFSFIFIIILLLIAFRALLAPLVTLLPAALVLALSSPVIAASTRLGVQASSITQVILIVLVLGAGTDYGLFLVFRTREELRRGLDPHAAVIKALGAVGETISFSAFTVIAALLSLLAATFGFYQGLGPALAIGIALMLLAGLTFLPALLAIFGRAVFWPSNVSRMETQEIGIWGNVASRAVRRPVITLVAGVALFLLLAIGYLNVGNTGFADQSSGPSGSDSAAGQAELTRHYPGASTNPSAIVFTFASPIWGNTGVLRSAQEQLTADPYLHGLFGPLNPNGIAISPAQLTALHARLGPAQALPRVQPAGLTVSPLAYNAYRSTAQYVSADGRTVQFVTVLTHNNGNSAKDVNAIVPLRDTIVPIAHSIGASDSGVFGLLAFAYDVNHISQQDLTHIIPLVALVILVLLAIVLRSLVAPFYLVASVVLSYFAALGFASLVFVHSGIDTGLNFVLPFLVFVFLMALGSDYNILVMTRIREEAHKMPLRQAVSLAVGISGSTITTAGMILAGSFAVLAVASGNQQGADQVKQIGYGIAAGVILDTFLVRTLLVPSAVIVLGRWNWWPSALSRRSIDAAEPELLRSRAGSSGLGEHAG